MMLRFIVSFNRMIKVLCSKYPQDVNTNQLSRSQAKKITAFLSEGNVLLQQGRYCTKEDIDARWDAIADYEFYK